MSAVVMFTNFLIALLLPLLFFVGCSRWVKRKPKVPTSVSVSSKSVTESSKTNPKPKTNSDSQNQRVSPRVSTEELSLLVISNIFRSRDVAEPMLLDERTGDTYREPVRDLQKNLLSVIHLDHTDKIVPSTLTVEEQNILLSSMSKEVRRLSVEKGTEKPAVDKVITYGASDDITHSERSLSSQNTDLEAEYPNLDPTLIRMIRHGARQFPFKYDELWDILDRGRETFAAECSLLEAPVPAVVYGDIHGQYSDLLRWFNLNGWPNRTRSVFLGDFVDRGSHGVEVVALLVLLKLHFPHNLFIVRGNHEEESLNRAYSFYEEVCSRFNQKDTPKPMGGAMYQCFKQMFMQIPLAVLVGGRVLGMHGGISPKLTSLQNIRNINRPIDDFDVGSLECDLVWSDPDTTADAGGYRPNFEREPQFGIGQLFSEETVKTVCDRLGVDLVIRGHQAPLYGYAFFSGGRMVTLFSAPGYKGSTKKDINMGACICIAKDMSMTIKQISVSEHVRGKRVADMNEQKAARQQILRSK